MKEKKHIRRILTLTEVIFFIILLSVSVSASTKAIEIYSVYVDTGYLALRTAQAYDSSNEKAKLYEGSVVAVLETSDTVNSDYCYVYSYDANDFGYVNRGYLEYSYLKTSLETRSVRVDTGYLAIRNAQTFDDRNEIGKLYTGDQVIILENYSTSNTYIPIYSFDKKTGGFVNKDYLVAGTVSDNSGSGISRGIRYDESSRVLSTDYFSATFPQSWLDAGVTYEYSDSEVKFYCTAVYEAPGMEDGYLGKLYRATSSDDDRKLSGVYYLRYVDGYYYYYARPTDFRANEKDADNCRKYKSMSADIDTFKNSIYVK